MDANVVTTNALRSSSRPLKFVVRRPITSYFELATTFALEKMSRKRRRYIMGLTAVGQTVWIVPSKGSWSTGTLEAAFDFSTRILTGGTAMGSDTDILAVSATIWRPGSPSLSILMGSPPSETTEGEVRGILRVSGELTDGLAFPFGSARYIFDSMRMTCQAFMKSGSVRARKGEIRGSALAMRATASGGMSSLPSK